MENMRKKGSTRREKVQSDIKKKANPETGSSSRRKEKGNESSLVYLVLRY